MPSSSNKKNASPKVTPAKLAAPGDGVAEADYDPNEERRVLRQLLARHGMVGDEHREAYDSLSTAARRSALGTKTRAPGVLRDGVACGVDSPEVNLIEGWVLQEMAEAQRCFDEARATTNVVPRLIALPSTRHVLGARRASPRPDSGESPPPVNGASPT